MVVFLEGAAEALDPKIYADRGNGFDARTGVGLEYSGSAVYVLQIAPPMRVKAIRIDPCSSELPFRYWAESARTEAEVERLVTKARADASGRTVRVYNVEIDGQREKRRREYNRKSIVRHYTSVIELARRTAPAVEDMLRHGPLISFVVPLHNTPARYLDDLLESFLAQPPGAAELILSDDGSSSDETRDWISRYSDRRGVKIIRSEVNRGIAVATNAGIAAAQTGWVALLDHDDALTPHSVQLIAKAIQENPDCQFLYTDEIVTDDNLRPREYFLKPAYDEVLLSGVNYINHLACYRRERLLAIGCMREGYEGSQDYDLLLRYLRDLSADQIKHLPYPVYQWRRSGASYSTKFLERSTENARRALGARYARSGKNASVDEALTVSLHRVRFDQQFEQWPSVSIVIPNRDSLTLISRVIEDLLTRTDYSDFEIIVVDNGSTDRAVLDLYERTANECPRFRVVVEPGPFNFSRQVNQGVELASGEFVLLLNNDVEVIEPSWLREMVSCFRYSDTGIVGTRLLYPNKRLQHAGVIAGLGGLAGHWFVGLSSTYEGPMGRLHVRQSFTVVTGACMLISRGCLEAVGRFDEKELAVAYNDVDFCLRAVAKGFRVVWTPFATLIHHESASRGSDETPANRVRFRQEQDVLRRRHRTDILEDRAFNPWFSRDRSEPLPILRKSLPKAR
jgi:GT2 family glycosyltransferase